VWYNEKEKKINMEDYTMTKKKEPTDGELMAKEIIAKYKPKTVADIAERIKRHIRANVRNNAER